MIYFKSGCRYTIDRDRQHNILHSEHVNDNIPDNKQLLQRMLTHTMKLTCLVKIYKQVLLTRPVLYKLRDKKPSDNVSVTARITSLGMQIVVDGGENVRKGGRGGFE